MIAAANDWIVQAWAAQPETFAMEVEGARIICRGWNLDRPDFPGIVLAHGFRAHARWWDHIAPWLTGGHRVVAFDFSGMGDSDHRADYARDQHAREVVAVATHLAFDRPTVIAHSYGGLIALLAARRQPDAFGRLVIIDSALPVNHDGTRHLEMGPTRVSPDRAAAVSRFRLLPPGGWPDPQLLNYIAEHSVRPVEDGWTWKFDPQVAESLNADKAFRDRMIGVTIPASFIYGALSEIVTAERLDQIATLMPHAGVPIAIPAAHHHVLLDQPLALISVLRTLIAAPCNREVLASEPTHSKNWRVTDESHRTGQASA